MTRNKKLRKTNSQMGHGNISLSDSPPKILQFHNSIPDASENKSMYQSMMATNEDLTGTSVAPQAADSSYQPKVKFLVQKTESSFLTVNAEQKNNFLCSLSKIRVTKNLAISSLEAYILNQVRDKILKKNKDTFTNYQISRKHLIRVNRHKLTTIINNIEVELRARPNVINDVRLNFCAEFLDWLFYGLLFLSVFQLSFKEKF
ncbi:hypothetical protein BpHYR1_008677 [Brachionus plicatilis]|uniref:Uncharacterized protein n=1 Tax=Brachionus plicatilis TaxID=10195 RepID=A0A3M7QG26_BRAPC|nr:hypothetical protein BpHYR1_008677 [Brachionus plicatilis]